MEEKVDNCKKTINNLLEKMNNMERRNEERMTKLMKEHRLELKRAQSDSSNGSSHGGHRTDGGGDRDRKSRDTIQLSTKEENSKPRKKGGQLID